jgi:hypothetical protein
MSQFLKAFHEHLARKMPLQRTPIAMPVRTQRRYASGKHTMTKELYKEQDQATPRTTRKGLDASEPFNLRVQKQRKAAFRTYMTTIDRAAKPKPTEPEPIEPMTPKLLARRPPLWDRL